MLFPEVLIETVITLICHDWLQTAYLMSQTSETLKEAEMLLLCRVLLSVLIQVGFTNTKLPPPPPQELWPARDLLPLADRRAQVVAPFSHPPSSFFTGSGSELGSKEYVYSRNEPILPAPHAEEGDGQQGLGGQAAPAAPQQQKCASWVAVDKPVMFEPIADLQHGSPAQQINLSPRLKGAR